MICDKIKKALTRHKNLYLLCCKLYGKWWKQCPLIQLNVRIWAELKYKENVFFVQVGSNDGTVADPIKYFVKKYDNWRGIFIEPVGYCFKELKKNYGSSSRFIFENKVIADKKGKSRFYYVSRKAKKELGANLPEWYTQLGSFDKNHILKHLDGVLAPYIVSKEVEAVTMQDIFDKHKTTNIDIIHIDTEGYDYHILTQIDFPRYNPVIVVFENKHLSDDEKEKAELLLKKSNYKCYTYGADTLAVYKGKIRE